MPPSRRHAETALAATALALLVGCAALWPRVEVSSRDGVDWTRYGTFAQQPAPPTQEDLPGYGESLGAEIQAAIAESLEAKGLAPATLFSADLLVAFSVDGQPRGSLEGGSDWTRDTLPVELPPGTLGIEIFDRRQRKLVWRGWSEAVRFDAEDASASRAVDTARRILERYPPPSG